MRFIGAVISVYMLLIFIRIFLTWFSGPSIGKPAQILAQITDPYLNYFRRIRFLRTDRFDFSPVIAIIVLSIFSNIAYRLAVFGSITLGIILAVVASALWSAFSFFLLFFLILIVVRFVALIAGANTVRPIWLTLDQILQPFVYRITSLITRVKTLNYQHSLLFCGGILLLIFIAGGFLIRAVTDLLLRLPV
jgi:YggT family protein